MTAMVSFKTGTITVIAKIIPIVVKIISNLRKIISNLFKITLLIIFTTSTPIDSQRVTKPKNCNIFSPQTKEFLPDQDKMS